MNEYRSTLGFPNRCRLAAVLVGAASTIGLASAQPSAQPVEPASAFESQSPSNLQHRGWLIGEGIRATARRSSFSAAVMPARSNADLITSGKRVGAVGGVFSHFDAAASDETFRLNAASLLPGDRLMLRASLHATRHDLSLATAYLSTNRTQVFPEFGLSYRLRHDFSVGAEYRFRPDNGRPAGPFGSRNRDGAWRDLFIAWSPSSNLSFTAAYVDLGGLALSPHPGRQVGHYLSAEIRY